MFKAKKVGGTNLEDGLWIIYGPFEKGQHFYSIPPGPSEECNVTLDASSFGCLLFISIPVSMVIG